jgi:hypothetical protein
VQTWQLVQCSSSNTSFSYIHAAAASPAREDTSLKYDTSAVVVRHISKICSDSHVKNVGTDCMVCWHENTLNETKRPPLPNHTSLDSVFVGRTIFIISSSSCLMMRLRAFLWHAAAQMVESLSTHFSGSSRLGGIDHPFAIPLPASLRTFPPLAEEDHSSTDAVLSECLSLRRKMLISQASTMSPLPLEIMTHLLSQDLNSQTQNLTRSGCDTQRSVIESRNQPLT